MTFLIYTTIMTTKRPLEQQKSSLVLRHVLMIINISRMGDEPAIVYLRKSNEEYEFAVYPAEMDPAQIYHTLSGLGPIVSMGSLVSSDNYVLGLITVKFAISPQIKTLTRYVDMLSSISLRVNPSCGDTAQLGEEESSAQQAQIIATLGDESKRMEVDESSNTGGKDGRNADFFYTTVGFYERVAFRGFQSVRVIGLRVCDKVKEGNKLVWVRKIYTGRRRESSIERTRTETVLLQAGIKTNDIATGNV